MSPRQDASCHCAEDAVGHAVGSVYCIYDAAMIEDNTKSAIDAAGLCYDCTRAPGRQAVRLCPLHAAAGELVRVLTEMTEFWDNNSPVWPGALVVGEAREALARAKGRCIHHAGCQHEQAQATLAELDA